jgi:hypothetical protein
MTTILDESSSRHRDTQSPRDTPPGSPSLQDSAELLHLMYGRGDDVDAHHRYDYISPRDEGAAALSALRSSPPPTLNTPLGNVPIITSEQLQELIGQSTTTIKSNQSNAPVSEENLISIAKSEYYISQGLSFKFDGDHECLAPWIKKFKALRANALWKDATYLTHENKRYDL